MRTAACCRQSSSGSHLLHSSSLIVVVPSDAHRIWGTALLSLLLGVAWDIDRRGRRYAVASPRPLLPRPFAVTTRLPPPHNTGPLGLFGVATVEKHSDRDDDSPALTAVRRRPPSSWLWLWLPLLLVNRPTVTEASSAVATEVSESSTHLAGTLRRHRCHCCRERVSSGDRHKGSPIHLSSRDSNFALEGLGRPVDVGVSVQGSREPACHSPLVVGSLSEHCKRGHVTDRVDKVGLIHNPASTELQRCAKMS